MPGSNYGNTYTVTTSQQSTSYDYTNSDGSTTRKGTSTHNPPAELLDSDNEGEADDTYDDDGEAIVARASSAQQRVTRGAQYKEENSSIQIVQLDQGAGGELDDVQLVPLQEEVVSDDDGKGYESSDVEEEEEEEESGGSYGEDY